MTPPPSPAAGLNVESVGFGYGGEHVLDDVTFNLRQGRVACLIGPSGGGKTTLLHLVGGLMKPWRGAIRHSFARPAFVFQAPLLLPWRTARGNVAFALTGTALERRARWQRAGEALAQVGLEAGDQGKYPHTLSGGMQKRVALARALAIEPDLLLLDEPFSALDPGLARRLEGEVHRQIERRGLTAVMVTHDFAEAVRMADRIVVLAGRPAGVVAVHDIDRPAGERDARFVTAEIDRLLARPGVEAAFSGEG